MVKAFRKLLLVRMKKLLAVRGCMDAHRPDTYTGSDQCDEKRYSIIKFHHVPYDYSMVRFQIC
jgi:hypothetical protein